MKKLLVVLMLVAVVGCTGIMSNTVFNMGSDLAFVAYLQKAPRDIPKAVDNLKIVKEYVACTECSFDVLKQKIILQYGGDYKIYAIVLSDYINADIIDVEKILSPDDKVLINKKIDRLILLAGLVECNGSCPVK